MHIVDAAFHLAFVPRRIRPRRQQHHAVVLAERAHLGIELGIEPVGRGHRRTQVIGDQALRHTAEGAEGILQATDECLGRLAIDRFAVALARMAQHHAQHMRSAAFAGRVHNPGALAEVDLRLLPPAGTPDGGRAVPACAPNSARSDARCSSCLQSRARKPSLGGCAARSVPRPVWPRSPPASPHRRSRCPPAPPVPRGSGSSRGARWLVLTRRNLDRAGGRAGWF